MQFSFIFFLKYSIGEIDEIGANDYFKMEKFFFSKKNSKDSSKGIFLLQSQS